MRKNRPRDVLLELAWRVEGFATSRGRTADRRVLLTSHGEGARVGRRALSVWLSRETYRETGRRCKRSRRRAATQIASRRARRLSTLFPPPETSLSGSCISRRVSFAYTTRRVCDIGRCRAETEIHIDETFATSVDVFAASADVARDIGRCCAASSRRP